jgi:hypothetical protein
VLHKLLSHHDITDGNPIAQATCHTGEQDLPDAKGFNQRGSGAGSGHLADPGQHQDHVPAVPLPGPESAPGPDAFLGMTELLQQASLFIE